MEQVWGEINKQNIEFLIHVLGGESLPTFQRLLHGLSKLSLEA
jgi:hypothetical protein